MQIPDNIMKCVVFLGYLGADGLHRTSGTAFFVGNLGVGSIYLVTAKHVIDGIRSTGATEVYVRYNTVAGTCIWLSSKVDGWISHPTDPHVDVSILPTSITTDLDHLALDMNLFANSERISENEIGVGDEVFITGLFVHHTGKNKNIPIVRCGSIAAMVGEPVILGSGAMIEAYLIEARSIGGISGSPVFVNCGSSRIINGVMKHATGASSIYFLIGLMHGHFQSGNRENAGIAIVVPQGKIVETLRQPAVLEMEARLFPNSITSNPPAS